MKKVIILTLIVILSTLEIFAQEKEKKEKIKKGFSLGGVPVVAYDSDTGFKYGGLVNLYWYGDGSNYPNYNHSLYMEVSRTTKGGGINQIKYDTRTLIPNIRMRLEAKYLTEKALDFYGFNGYNSYFNQDFATKDHSDYISKMFYRHERKMLRLSANFEGNIKKVKGLRWLLGFDYNNVKIATVDIDKLNKGKDESDKLPDTTLLYDRYVEWGVIPKSQATGGVVNNFKVGAIYDSRDNEANPNRGIWSEIMFLTAPKFLGNDNPFSKIVINHRQYLTVVKNKLTFAYRLSWQQNISDEMPFYMLPFVYASNAIENGLGGSKNIRGLYRNNLQGNGIAYGNMEFRWKFFQTVVFNQNLYLGLNTFLDGGLITDKYKLDLSGVKSGYGNTKDENLKWFDYEEEKIHPTYGAGLRIAINNNFIIAIEYGRSFNVKKDGQGFYVGLDYAF